MGGAGGGLQVKGMCPPASGSSLLPLSPHLCQHSGLFIEQNRKGRQGACFHTFHLTAVPCTCPPHFPVCSSPTSPQPDPLHGISKTTYNQLMWAQKVTSRNDEPWEGEDGSRDLAPSLWVPSFLESEGPPHKRGWLHC